MKNLKRFRLFQIDPEEKLVGKFDSLKECVEVMIPFWKHSSRSLFDFFVDDVKDDIEINWIDIMEAWDNGERPEDLQFF